MKKLLALILSVALVLSVVILPTATFVSAETLGTELTFSDAITVLSEEISPRAIRTKELSDGTVAAVYYKSGSGIFYATSPDGGITFRNEVKLISNATDSELAASDEVTTQTTIAKQYVSAYGQYGRGRLEAQNPNLIELANGNIAVFYRYNTFTTSPDTKPWSEYYASICYQILDKETGVWGDVQVMVESHNNKPVLSEDSDYGLWEPDPVYIGDELFCYYADTYTPNNLSEQHIMYCVYDEATGKFGAPQIAQNGTNHKSRDGMSVVTKLSDGTYAMVFESTRTAKDDYTDIHNYTTFVIKMSFSKDGRNWTDPVIVAKPEPVYQSATTSDEYAVCASPYVVTLPDGRLAVSYQTTDRYTGRIPNRVSYRIGTQVAISSEAITYDTFANKTINDDVTSYFATELNPGIMGENEFSKSAQLMVKDNRLHVYYSVGNNSWTEVDGAEKETHDFGDIRMAYIDLATSDDALDATLRDNYIVYNSGKKDITDNGNGTFAFPTGTTNMIYGKYGKEIVDSPITIGDLYSEDTYTRHGGTYTFDTENDVITTKGQGKALITSTANMKKFNTRVTIQGNTIAGDTNEGYILGGLSICVNPNTISKTTFNPEGILIAIRREKKTLNKIELVVRYCDSTGSAKDSFAKVLSSNFDATDLDPKFTMDVSSDGANYTIKVYNAETGAQMGSTYTYSLSRVSTLPFTKGALSLVVNGVHTFTDFTITGATEKKEIDNSIIENTTNLDAHAAITFPATVDEDNQVGMSFRVQQAADASPGITGYVLKLLQTTDGDSNITVQLTRYGTTSAGKENQNLGNMYTEVDSTILGTGSEIGSTILFDAKLRENILNVTLTNAADESLKSTYEFDLTTKAGNYDTYYENGGFGFFKNGNATEITVSDIEFTKVAKNVCNIDASLYTTYTAEGSEGIVYEDEKFVSKEAVAKKIMLNDTVVSDFSANATLEIGYDGQLKAGIIFRAKNVGNDTDAMEGYSAVLWKNENGTGNFGRVLLLVYKWGINADGETVYLGEVGRLDDRKTLNAVYPDAEKSALASVGAHLKLNIKVDGDVIRANFDVLNENNDIAASSDVKSISLDKKFAAEKVNTYYESGAIGLSISTAGAICDFNITESVMGKEMSEMSDYVVYSNDDKTMTIDSSVNKKMYSVSKGRKQAVLSGVPLTNFEASAILKSNTAGEVYNMGFDFMINEDTHSGQAYNTTHTTMGYEGYRAVLVRNANNTDNPAKAVLYLFKFTKDENGYTRTQIKAVGNDDFFADYTTADTTDKEYAEVEVQLDVKLVDGNLTAVATMCEYPERTITLTAEGLEGSGSVGWFISDQGSVSQISVNSVVVDGDLDADGNVNATDLAIMRKVVMGEGKVGLAIGDISVKDREIDIRDIVKLKKLIAGIE